MPEYSYICHHCNNTFEIFLSLLEYNPECVCPVCERPASRDYKTDLPNTSVRKGDGEVTLGTLAQRNTERMSPDEKAHLTHKHNEYKYQEPQKALAKGMTRLGPPNDRKTPKKQRKRDIKKRNKNGK